MMTAPHAYSDLFHTYVAAGSSRSARQILPLLLKDLKPSSVLDVGCSAGAWLTEYQNLGLQDIFGIDSTAPQNLLIPPEHFKPLDLTHPFDLASTFDLVQ